MLLRSLCFLLLTLPCSLYAAEHAVILQYHHVSEHTPASTSLSPRQFAQHLDYLARHQFQVWRLEHIVQHLQTGQPLPDKTVAITFDDGYRNVYEHAFPLLQARGWPFTLFVNAPAIESGNPLHLTWSQIQEMAAAGATIANHTLTHPHLVRRRPDESEVQWQARLRQEILANEDAINGRTGQRHQLLAYPYGEYSEAVKTLVKTLGFTAFGQQSGPAGPTSDLQALPRFPASGPYADLAGLKAKLWSLPLPVTRAEPSDPLLAPDQSSPSLRLQLAAADYRLAQLACYASGQGRISHRILSQQPLIIEITPNAALPVGRSRYNCTAPHRHQNRYYWFSQPWIKPHPDGRWHQE